MGEHLELMISELRQVMVRIRASLHIVKAARTRMDEVRKKTADIGYGKATTYMQLERAQAGGALRQSEAETWKLFAVAWGHAQSIDLVYDENPRVKRINLKVDLTDLQTFLEI